MENVGYFAAFCTTLAFVPQTMKVIKSKDTKALSLSMYIVFCLGVFCFVLYGYFSKDLPIFWANLTTLFFALIVLRMKIKHG